MSLLKYDTTKKERVDKTTTQLKFEANNNGKKYKVIEICDSVVYAKKSKGQLLDLY